MPLNSALEQRLEEASTAVGAHPEHRLGLTLRRRIWDSMGPLLRSGDFATSGPGNKRRTVLAILCAKYVLDIWSSELPADTTAASIVTLARRCVEGQIERGDLSTIAQEFWTSVDARGDLSNSAVYVAAAVT